MGEEVWDLRAALPLAADPALLRAAAALAPRSLPRPIATARERDLSLAALPSPTSVWPYFLATWTVGVSQTSSYSCSRLKVLDAMHIEQPRAEGFGRRTYDTGSYRQEEAGVQGLPGIFRQMRRLRIPGILVSPAKVSVELRSLQHSATLACNQLWGYTQTTRACRSQNGRALDYKEGRTKSSRSCIGSPSCGLATPASVPWHSKGSYAGKPAITTKSKSQDIPF